MLTHYGYRSQALIWLAGEYQYSVLQQEKKGLKIGTALTMEYRRKDGTVEEL